MIAVESVLLGEKTGEQETRALCRIPWMESTSWGCANQVASGTSMSGGYGRVGGAAEASGRFLAIQASVSWSMT